MKKRTKQLIYAIVFFLFINVAGFYYINQNKTEISEETWRIIQPNDTYSSDGSAWKGLYKQGTENKTLLFFVGGGMSFSQEMDESNQQGFYEESVWYLDQLPYYAVFANTKENPFRNWNFIIVPYSSGDLHIGNVIYEDEEGNRVYHQGYKNYRLFMEEIKPLLGNSEELVITGSSAGGFAAALLSEDVIQYFPETKNIVTLVDAGFLLYDNWLDCAQNFWEAPDEITNRIHSNNIVLDSLQALREEREEVKILFACSTRDSALQSYQNYIDNQIFGYSIEAGDQFYSNLKEMVQGILDLENSGVYIFDTLVDEEYQLTKHMILPSKAFSECVENKAPVEWIEEALQGNIHSYGLDLVKE